jgi:hypothetical protein
MIARVIQCSALAAIASLALAACASASDGPLQFTTNENQMCAPRAEYSHAALGTALDYTGSDAITIQSVEPVHPTGLKVLDSYVMPVTPALRFMFDNFPPTDQFPDAWLEAKPAGAFTVPTSGSFDLITEVQATGDGDAVLDGLTVVYTVGGRTYEATTHLSFKIVNGSCN